MRSRYTRVLAVLTTAGAIAVPAVAQARGGSDDPPNHEQHQVEHHRRHDRSATGRHDRRHDRVDNDRRDRRGGDDGPGHH